MLGEGQATKGSQLKVPGSQVDLLPESRQIASLDTGLVARQAPAEGDNDTAEKPLAKIWMRIQNTSEYVGNPNQTVKNKENPDTNQDMSQYELDRSKHSYSFSYNPYPFDP